MPKSSKKKKDKAADFSKAKLKLGKGKQVASNVVDTSFKARSIALPTQSIATDKDGDAPTTKRRLTFDALILHLKHYNASTRRDAILGLRELLEAHPELIGTHLTTLVNSCVRIIGDEDASVRKTLLSFFAWLLRQVPQDDLLPHSPVLLLFTTSAQTHIFPEIRIDAVRFLDIFLDYIPDVVTEGWTTEGSGSHGRRVLEGYLGILNAGTSFGEGGDTGPVQATSTASVVLSPSVWAFGCSGVKLTDIAIMQSKLVVLKSLASFLAHAVTANSTGTDVIPEANTGTLTTPTWYFSSSFASTSAFNAFDALIRPISTPSPQADSRRAHLTVTREWVPEVSDEGEEDFVGHFSLATSGVSTLTVQELNGIEGAVSATTGEGQASNGLDPKVTSAMHVARALQSTLVATFLDCAPAVFSPSSTPPEAELQMVLVVCRICRSLYGRILQNAAESGRSVETAESDLQAILSYLSPYFPFTISGPSTTRRDIKVEQAFQDLNLIFCELSSFLVLTSQGTDKHLPTTHRPKARSSRAGPRSLQSSASAPVVSARQIERVSEYIVQLLRGEIPASGVPSSIPRSIAPQAYVSLLPTVWSLLNGRQSEVADASTTLFSAAVEHATKASSASAVKKHTIDFIGRLVLLDREPEYVGSFRSGRSQEQDAKLKEWILQLPKTLWELGANHPATTETIVRLLLRLSQRRSPLFHAEVYAALRSRLIPYFTITHPTRGKLPGPFAKLPANSPLRRLVLDLVATLVSQSTRQTNLGEGDLIPGVEEAVRGTSEEAYWAGLKASVLGS
ncbi:hypothetical protein BV20DRAFT_265919 [Pilatotrama ljubarskyi]|nr:hypothetical protein BV20DRAFT_265919 [Pilatotrama ljubarskyi]